MEHTPMLLLERPLERIEELLVTELLPKEALAQYRAGAVAKTHFDCYAEALAKLSQGYVERREPGRLAYIFRDVDAEAYALYFTLINAAKFLHLFAQLPAGQKVASILDYGCGPATAALAALAAFGPQIKKIVAVDQNQPMLQIAERCLRMFAAAAGSSPVAALHIATTIPSEDQKFDLILCGNVFNENQTDWAQARLLELRARLAPGGKLLLIEPALKPSTRQAMELRDILVAAGMIPLFPCTHAASCPMRKQDSDNWCHYALEWEQPQLVRVIDSITGFNKHRIKSAGFIFADEGTVSGGERLLLDPERSKRGLQLFVCGAERYGAALLPKSDERYAAVKKMRAFEVVS